MTLLFNIWGDGVLYGVITLVVIYYLVYEHNVHFVNMNYELYINIYIYEHEAIKKSKSENNIGALLVPQKG